MNPRSALFLAGMVVLVVVLVLLFPALLEFIEKFAGELRFFWWVVLLLALAAWLLVWGFGKKDK